MFWIITLTISLTMLVSTAMLDYLNGTSDFVLPRMICTITAIVAAFMI